MSECDEIDRSNGTVRRVVKRNATDTCKDRYVCYNTNQVTKTKESYKVYGAVCKNNIVYDCIDVNDKKYTLKNKPCPIIYNCTYVAGKKYKLADKKCP